LENGTNAVDLVTYDKGVEFLCRGVQADTSWVSQAVV
jgi:hypothetical protein